jgi:hypothetical protein
VVAGEINSLKESVQKLLDCSDGYYSEGLEYTLKDNGEYEVSGIGECKDTEIVIPRYKDGRRVTSIGELAFDNKGSITSVIIPDSVTRIGSAAFGGCSSLESITLPFVGETAKTESDTYQYPFGFIFGEGSYTGCVATPQDYIINNNTHTASVYYIPASLKSVTITGGNILYGAFGGCSNLTSVIINDSVTKIGFSAFKYCTSLTSVTIPNSVTSIGENTFYKCSSLTSVMIPDSVTTIHGKAFRSCTSLTRVNIPNSVTSINGDPFMECGKVTVYCEQYAKPDGWSETWSKSVAEVVWGTRFDPSVEDSTSSHIQSEPPSISMKYLNDDCQKYGLTTTTLLINKIYSMLLWGVAIYMREHGTSDWVEFLYETNLPEDVELIYSLLYITGFDENKTYDICVKKIEYGKLMSPVSNIVQYKPCHLSGSYVFNEVLGIPPVQNIRQNINYTIHINGEDINCVAIEVADDEGEAYISCKKSGGGMTCYHGKWLDGVSRTITFTSEQVVSLEFYDWFIKNTTKL